jgi:hypothetical protein
MEVPLLGIIIGALVCLWASVLTYLAWFRPDRLVPPLWYWRNRGYDLWITRLLAPVLAVIRLVILLRILLCIFAILC